MLDDSASRRGSCPIDAQTEEWINARTSWLLDQFGRESILARPMVLPTTEFFPDAFDGTEEAARQILDLVCGYMDVDPDLIDLEFYFDGDRVDGGESALGLYEEDGGQFVIGIELRLLDDPLALCATMAHELGHVHLLGNNRVGEDDDDHEPLTDLLTVLMGLGVITSNAVLHSENWQSGTLEGWHVARRGYLTMPMYGYALALVAHLRYEEHPAWAKHLRPDVKHSLQKSFRYLAEVGLPDFSIVATTTARPVLTLEPNALAEDDELDRHELGNARAVCTFCGEIVADEGPYGICEMCQQSIEENQDELELDRQRAEQFGQRRQKAVRVGCVLIVIAFAVLVFFDLLG